MEKKIFFFFFFSWTTLHYKHILLRIKIRKGYLFEGNERKESITKEKDEIV
jgi:hypothetical protein